MILGKVGEVHVFKHMLYITALEQARVWILGKYVLLGLKNTINKHCHYGLYISALEQVWKLILSRYVLLAFIKTICVYSCI